MNREAVREGSWLAKVFEPWKGGSNGDSIALRELRYMRFDGYKHAIPLE